jgi:hypothetical protein
LGQSRGSYSLVDSQNFVKRYHRTAGTPQSRWRRVRNAALITVLLVAFTLLMLPLFLFLAVFSAWKNARGRNERLPERARWLASALLMVSLTACDNEAGELLTPQRWTALSSSVAAFCGEASASAFVGSSSCGREGVRPIQD